MVNVLLVPYIVIVNDYNHRKKNNTVISKMVSKILNRENMEQNSVDLFQQR